MWLTDCGEEARCLLGELISSYLCVSDSIGGRSLAHHLSNILTTRTYHHRNTSSFTASCGVPFVARASRISVIFILLHLFHPFWWIFAIYLRQNTAVRFASFVNREQVFLYITQIYCWHLLYRGYWLSLTARIITIVTLYTSLPLTFLFVILLCWHVPQCA